MKVVLAAIVGIIIGAGGVMAFSKSTEPMPSSGSHVSGTSMQGMMDDMMKALEGKEGDEFDKAFLAEMIVHHQGAIEMAEIALKSARHEEVKKMAQDIISAQEAEIAQMQEWQQSWYGESSASDSDTAGAHHAQ